MSKITELTTLTSPAAGDLLPIVDISDTTLAATGTNKGITSQNLVKASDNVEYRSDSAFHQFEYDARTKFVTLGNTNTQFFFNLTGLPDGAKFELWVRRTGTGTVTWLQGISWDGGSEPAITSTTNKISVFVVRYINGSLYGTLAISEI